MRSYTVASLGRERTSKTRQVLIIGKIYKCFGGKEKLDVGREHSEIALL